MSKETRPTRQTRQTRQTRFPSAWTLIQALPIAQLDDALVQRRERLMRARCRAQLAISFLDDVSERVAGGDADSGRWYQVDAQAMADEALELMLEDNDAWLDEEKTHS